MSGFSWGYGERDGPVHWNEFFPIADGDQQSPIEIKTKEVRYDSSLRPLGIKYDASSAKIISNSGHSFNVDFDDTDDKSVLRGGPLTGSYRLRQFHLHWGSADDHGSEHVVDGVRYAAEGVPSRDASGSACGVTRCAGLGEAGGRAETSVHSSSSFWSPGLVVAVKAKWGKALYLNPE
ncbi:hypothetical protein K5549_014189 [Capra hircus]|nr:hypothetical protein K5549_014189 [Capra hircus]